MNDNALFFQLAITEATPSCPGPMKLDMADKEIDKSYSSAHVR